MPEYPALPADHPVQIALSFLAWRMAALQLDLARGVLVGHLELSLKSFDNSVLRVVTALAAAKAEDPEFADKYGVRVDQPIEELAATFGNRTEVPDTPEGLT